MEGGGTRWRQASAEAYAAVCSTCRMTIEQQRELGKIITAGALATGYATDLLTTIFIRLHTSCGNVRDLRAYLRGRG